MALAAFFLFIVWCGALVCASNVENYSGIPVEDGLQETRAVRNVTSKMNKGHTSIFFEKYFPIDPLPYL